MRLTDAHVRIESGGYIDRKVVGWGMVYSGVTAGLVNNSARLKVAHIAVSGRILGAVLILSGRSRMVRSKVD